ncbi:hypothetical protein MSHOH_1663 [Methanosarcina horonobensis HB-1 = JCM 15518]|uniref:Uncharacterized protein n=1 Tax=Methanosarcina horonobensis HB-1 = JCM 15518 TaxID=1434110 RepID=A0A0E3SBC1_9EURY|nr:hypothetical protein MSHOH_1663 [Methanosarcina horonobensis HB-1 = JCM 15518]
MPQNAPLSAPAPAMLVNWLVSGFFFPSGQETMAASCRVISCLLLKSSTTASASSAPRGVLNFRTVRVAMFKPPFIFTFFLRCFVFMPARQSRCNRYLH